MTQRNPHLDRVPTPDEARALLHAAVDDFADGLRPEVTYVRGLVLRYIVDDVRDGKQIESHCHTVSGHGWAVKVRAQLDVMLGQAEPVPKGTPGKLLRRGIDFACEECGKFEGSRLDNGYWRCHACGYPSK